MRRLVRIAGILLVLLSFVYIGRLAYQVGPELVQIDRAALWTGLLPATLLYSIGIFVGAVAWVLLLGIDPRTVQVSELIRAFCVSQIGKYAPGNFAHHVGKAIWTKRLGVPGEAIASALLLEVAWVVCAGAVLGSAFIPAALNIGPEHLFGFEPQLVFILLSALFCLLLPLFLLWLKNAGDSFPIMPAVLRRVHVPPLKNLVAALGLLFVPFLLVGLGIELLIDALGAQADLALLGLAGAFAAAWVAGFVIPGASAGIGVREAIVVALLAPFVGEVAALQVAIMLRVATVCGDVLVFLIGIAVGRARREVSPSR